MNVLGKTFLKSFKGSFLVVGDRTFQSAKTLLKDLRSPQLVTDFVVRMISLERVLLQHSAKKFQFVSSFGNMTRNEVVVHSGVSTKNILLYTLLHLNSNRTFLDPVFMASGIARGRVRTTR